MPTKTQLSNLEESMIKSYENSSTYCIFLGFLCADGTIQRLVSTDDLQAAACMKSEAACSWSNELDAIYDCESIYDEEFNTVKHGLAMIYKKKSVWYKQLVPHNRHQFLTRFYKPDGSRKTRLDSVIGQKLNDFALSKFPTDDLISLLQYFGGGDIEINRLARSLINSYRHFKIKLSNDICFSGSDMNRKPSYKKIIEIILSDQIDEMDFITSCNLQEFERLIDEEEYAKIQSVVQPHSEHADLELIKTIHNKIESLLLAGPNCWDCSTRGNAGVIPSFASYSEQVETKKSHPVQQFTNVEDVLKMLGIKV